MRLATAALLLLGSIAVVAGCGEGGDDAGSDPAALEGTPWVLVAGVELGADDEAPAPSATFEADTVGGSTGCNRYSAPVTVDGDALTLGTIAMTQMACPPPADRIERDFVDALGRVTGWQLDGDELVLVDADDAELLRFAEASLVGEWEATGILRDSAVVSPLAGTALTARFAADGGLSGSAGCNRYTTTYTAATGALTLGEVGSTRMACGEPEGVMGQEAEYLQLLGRAARYRLDGQTLDLLDEDGARLVTYVRAA